MSPKPKHSQRSGKRIVGILGAVLLNMVLLFTLVSLQTFSSAVPAAQTPTVSVAEQRDVPLLIIFEGYDFSVPSSPQVIYNVQNNSDKPVRAYSILEETVAGAFRGTGVKIVNLDKGRKFLQPAQTRRETCDISSQAEPVTALALSVDFVEFSDGTTWGVDTRRSGEYVAGQREGKKAVVRKLRETRDAEGVGAVVELLKKKEGELVELPAGRSQEWEYGFRVGRNAALYQLTNAHAKGGTQALSSELEKALEYVEGRDQ